jgi:hypothetical protein
VQILDIDMDYFLTEKTSYHKDRKQINNKIVWTKSEIIEFLEKKLGLSKNNKIKGRIVTYHNEALNFWEELVDDKKLKVPFEVIHVDSHADLGLGIPGWSNLFDKVLILPVDERQKYVKNSEFKYHEGNYLLFALLYRWISSLTYIPNKREIGNDYLWGIMKNGNEESGYIEIPYNSQRPQSDIYIDTKRFLENCTYEPQVEFKVINKFSNIDITNNYDFLSFAISPNYTPESSDFIII